MLNERIPSWVDPIKCASRHKEMQGEVAVADLTRVSSLSLGGDRSAVVNLRFGIDEQQQCLITGQIRVDLLLQCQRCMQPFEQAISVDVHLVLNTEMQSELLDRGKLSITQLVEDEILLGLPMVPKHEQADCSSSEYLKDAQPVKQSPFEALKFMKDNLAARR